MPKTRKERIKYMRLFAVIFFSFVLGSIILIFHSQDYVLISKNGISIKNISTDIMLDIIAREFLISGMLTSMFHGFYYLEKWKIIILYP